MLHLPFRVLNLIHKPHLPPHLRPTIHHRFPHCNSQMVHAKAVRDKRWDTPFFSRSWNAPCQRGEFIVKFLWKKRTHMDIPTPRLWSFSSMASSDISVTDGEVHWTMIACAPSSPITGDLGLDLRRSARCLNITILNLGRIRNKHQPLPYLLHPNLLRPRSRRSQSKSCRWPGS